MQQQQQQQLVRGEPSPEDRRLEDRSVGEDQREAPCLIGVERLRQADRISCSRISVNQVTMRQSRQHGIGASIFRFSYRTTCIAFPLLTGYSFDLRARPSWLHAAALAERGERIRAYSVSHKQPTPEPRLIDREI